MTHPALRLMPSVALYGHEIAAWLTAHGYSPINLAELEAERERRRTNDRKAR